MSILLSVIIPTFNREIELQRCLDALVPGNQGLEAADYEIIVSDDSSSESMISEIGRSYPGIKFTKGPGKGPASNRNHAAKQASGDYLVFVDDDCIPDKNMLAAYFKVFKKSEKCEVFEGRIYAGREQQYFDETSPINENGGRLWSCNFAIKRKLFLELGGFDERFPYAAMEDVELQTRIKNGGFKITFVRDAAVCHPWRKKLISDFKKHELSTLLYLNIHPEESKRINSAYYSYLALYGICRFLLPGLMKGKFRGFSVQLLEYLYFFRMSFKLAFKV